jgi:hypothetical protein
MILLALQLGTDFEAAIAESRRTGRPICVIVADEREASAATLSNVQDPQIDRACPDLIKVRVAPGEWWGRVAPTLVLLHPPQSVEARPEEPARCRLRELLERRVEVDFSNTPLEDTLGVFETLLQMELILDPDARERHSADTVTIAKTAPLSELLSEILDPLKLSLDVQKEAIIVRAVAADELYRGRLLAAMRFAETAGLPELTATDRATAERLKRPVKGPVAIEGIDLPAEVARIAAAVEGVEIRVHQEVTSYFIAGDLKLRDTTGEELLNTVARGSGLVWYLDDGVVVVAARPKTVAISTDRIGEFLRQHVPCDPALLPSKTSDQIGLELRRLADDSAAVRQEAAAALHAWQERTPTTNSLIRRALDGSLDPDFSLHLKKVLGDDPRLPAYRP